MTIGMSINSAADIDAKREILGRLIDLTELAAEVELWFNGRPAAWTFGELAGQLRENILRNPVLEENPHA
jgi:hypothetical protein